MAILHFIDLRFRSGIRVSQEQIATYYQKTLVPALAKDNEKAPPLAEVSGRIQEILLQQQVSGLFQDWLTSLHDQGNVKIVDPAYSADFDAKTAAVNQ
jgi:peptidyl-prolyl cis-trans isomerase SurA